MLKDILSLDDFERAARARLPRPIFAYVSGGSEDNVTLGFMDGRLVSAEGAAGLAEAIAAVLAESASERHVLRGRVRQIVEDEHHLGALADTIVAHLAELAEGGG